VSQRFYAECLQRFSHPDDVLHLVQKPEKMIKQLYLSAYHVDDMQYLTHKTEIQIFLEEAILS
jgi:hypothetical protein